MSKYEDVGCGTFLLELGAVVGGFVVAVGLLGIGYVVVDNIIYSLENLVPTPTPITQLFDSPLPIPILESTAVWPDMLPGSP
ncbi:hypothetical protein KKD62_02570 [Patescibacteria group bacterium]|nr:hypothetical protein [Patescibacteria group bacterium]MBU1931610.1 hypothetical protein [Patescibacteria group bacterium]